MAQSTPAPRPAEALPQMGFDDLDEDTIVTGVRYVAPVDDDQRDTDVIPESGPDEETTAVMNNIGGMVRKALAPRPLPQVEEPDYATLLSTDPDEDSGFPIDLDDEKLEDYDK